MILNLTQHTVTAEQKAQRRVEPRRCKDEIEKLLKTGRAAKPPEHNFQIICFNSEPKLVDVNKPIFIDPKKYPSPHIIIYKS